MTTTGSVPRDDMKRMETKWETTGIKKKKEISTATIQQSGCTLTDKEGK